MSLDPNPYVVDFSKDDLRCDAQGWCGVDSQTPAQKHVELFFGIVLAVIIAAVFGWTVLRVAGGIAGAFRRR